MTRMIAASLHSFVRHPWLLHADPRRLAVVWLLHFCRWRAGALGRASGLLLYALARERRKVVLTNLELVLSGSIR